MTETLVSPQEPNPTRVKRPWGVILSLALTAVLIVAGSAVLLSRGSVAPMDPLQEAINKELKWDPFDVFSAAEASVRVPFPGHTVVMIRRTQNDGDVQVDPIWFSQTGDRWRARRSAFGQGFGHLTCSRMGLPASPWLCHVEVVAEATSVEVRFFGRPVKGRAEDGIGVVVVDNPVPYSEIAVFDASGKQIQIVQGIKPARISGP